MSDNPPGCEGVSSPLWRRFDDRAGSEGTMIQSRQERYMRRRHRVPLNIGSSPSSSLALLRLPSLFAEAASALFSCASRSSPSTDVRGVGGARGFAGWRNVCFWMMNVHQDSGHCREENAAHRILTHQTTLPDRFGLEYIAVVDDDALDGLRGYSCGLLLVMRQDFCMEFCKEGISELAKRPRRCYSRKCSTQITTLAQQPIHTCDEPVYGVVPRNVLHTFGEQIVGVDEVQSPREFNGNVVSEVVRVISRRSHREARRM